MKTTTKFKKILYGLVIGTSLSQVAQAQFICQEENIAMVIKL